MNVTVDVVKVLYEAGRNQEVIAALPTGWETGCTTQERAALHYYRGAAAAKLDMKLVAAQDLKAAYRMVEHVDDCFLSCYIVIGEAVRLHGHGAYDAAVRLLQQALSDYAQDDIQKGYALWWLGWSHEGLGDYSTACQTLEESATFLRRAESVDYSGVMIDLAHCHLKRGAAAEALRILSTVEHKRGRMYPLWVAQFDRNMARALKELGRTSEAMPWISSAHHYATKASSSRELSRIGLLASEIARESGSDDALGLASMAHDYAVCAGSGMLVESAKAVMASGGGVSDYNTAC